MTDTVTVRVPATTANIGPGFDSLGLALDLWNETTFTIGGRTLEIVVLGEGRRQLPLDETNLIYQSFCRVYSILEMQVPTGLRIACHNQIPLCSGLGSSSAAVLAGIMGANDILGNPLNEARLLQLASQIEGHPDNVAPAFYGGLTISIQHESKVITQKIPVPEWQMIVILPELQLSTVESRNVLPESVPVKDAVFNIGRTALVVEALRQGNSELLNQAIHDRLHQPYRLALIPGAQEVLQMFQKLGVPAALSGAGPSVIAFSKETNVVRDIMVKAFRKAGTAVRCFTLNTSAAGAQCETP